MGGRDAVIYFDEIVSNYEFVPAYANFLQGHDRDMQQLVNTSVPFDMHLERAAIPAAVERALATSKPQIANLFSQSESQQHVPWQGVEVEDLVRAQLAHFADLVSFRIAVHGPRLRLNPASAQAIGLALHAIVIKAMAERGVSGAVDFEYARHWA
jgi:hypothetical protein